ncbi:hypothetical protein HZH68_007429 [Vespula germanica]|uniref:Secreted protein n=1 Tax=Vespula germanica TaxID=30212 RepID=A0A834KB19_VESGE|nr:hypothetical protein HZH68_007429 [Vespula germanica]
MGSGVNPLEEEANSFALLAYLVAWLLACLLSHSSASSFPPSLCDLAQAIRYFAFRSAFAFSRREQRSLQRRFRSQK